MEVLILGICHEIFLFGKKRSKIRVRIIHRRALYTGKYGKRNIVEKIVRLFSSVVYFGDFAKISRYGSLTELKYSLVFDLIFYYRSLQSRHCNSEGYFEVTCRVLVDMQVPAYNIFGSCIRWMTRNSAFSLERKYQ